MARSGYLLDALLVGGGLELVGGPVAQGAVQPGAVVPGDVLHGGAAGGRSGGPGLLVEALALQRGEERFGERIVPALAGPTGRQGHLQVAGEGGVGAADVLATLVRMEDHLGVGGGDRVGQRVSDQLGTEMLGQGEPDHPARGNVDHGGQIQPAVPGREVGDVATPAGIDRGGVDGKVAADQVRAGGGCRVGDGRALEPARRAATQPGGAHQACHTFAAMAVPATTQFGVDAWGAVAALGGLVGLADVLGELLIGALAGRDGAGMVGVVGGTGDLQQLARPLEGALLCLLRLDERIHVHRVSFAKKAVARLRISTSPRSRWFSRRRAASSWRSALVSPPSLRLPLSRSTCRTHSRTAVSVRSKSRATCPIERSPCWHSSTISALNSGVNDRRARGCLRSMVSMMDILPGAAPLMSGVRQTGSGPQHRQAAVASAALLRSPTSTSGPGGSPGSSAAMTASPWRHHTGHAGRARSTSPRPSASPATTAGYRYWRGTSSRSLAPSSMARSGRWFLTSSGYWLPGRSRRRSCLTLEAAPPSSRLASTTTSGSVGARSRARSSGSAPTATPSTRSGHRISRYMLGSRPASRQTPLSVPSRPSEPSSRWSATSPRGNMHVDDRRLLAAALARIWPPRDEPIDWPPQKLAFG